MLKNILVFLVSLLITLPSNNQYYFSYSNSDNQHSQTNCAFYAPEESESQVQPIDSERKNVTSLNFFKFISSVKGLKRYSNYFPNGIYGLKFECTATATGSKNMGRLSIDDIVLGMKTGSNENNYYITNYGKTAA